jgi:hypothetical protein
MSFPTKGLTAMNHKDAHYRFIFRNRGGKNELWVETSASAGGQYLVADVPRVVNREMVPLAIAFALANGWDARKTAPPFRCRYLKGSFLPLDDSPTD